MTTKISKLSDIRSFNLRPGSTLCDKYIVINRLGVGWEGEVYKVREIGTGIDRAAKIFYPERNIRNATIKFHARKMYRLRHCAILIQYLTSEEFYFKGHATRMLISELVEGQILADFVKSLPGKRFTVFEGLHFLHEFASGLEVIHNSRDYHGDLHWENVMVVRRGIGFDIKLIDLYRWGTPTGANIRDDVYDMIKIFYDIVGGQKFYSRHPDVVKRICKGLKRSLIYRKFPRAGALRSYLENMSWD